MSYSALMGIDLKKNEHFKLLELHNAWLFAPMIIDFVIKRYLKDGTSFPHTHNAEKICELKNSGKMNMLDNFMLILMFKHASIKKKDYKNVAFLLEKFIEKEEDNISLNLINVIEIANFLKKETKHNTISFMMTSVENEYNGIYNEEEDSFTPVDLNNFSFFDAFEEWKEINNTKYEDLLRSKNEQ